MFIEVSHEFWGIGLLNIQTGVFMYRIFDENETRKLQKDFIAVSHPTFDALESVDLTYTSPDSSERRIAQEREISDQTYIGITYDQLKSLLKNAGQLLYEFPEPIENASDSLSS